MKTAGLLPANGPADHGAPSPQPLCPEKEKGLLSASPDGLPVRTRTPRSPQKHSLLCQFGAPRTAPRSQLSRTAVTLAGHPGIEPTAGGAGQQHPVPNSPSQAAPVSRAGCKQRGSRLPAAAPDGLPLPSATARQGKRALADGPRSPLLLPQTQWWATPRPRLPGGKGQHRSPARQLRTYTENKTTLCQAPSLPF